MLKQNQKGIVLAGIVILSITVGIILPLLSNTSISALSCAPDDRTPLEKMQDSDAVFIGTVLTRYEKSNQNTSISNMGGLSYKVRIDEAVKGVEQGAETLVHGGSTNLVVGEEYLMFMSEVNGQLSSNLCSTSILGTEADTIAPYVADFDKVRDHNSVVPGPKILIAVLAVSTPVLLAIYYFKKARSK